KSKRAKDVAYHREKMLLCKQEEAGIQLNADQADWKDDTDDAVDSGPIFDTGPKQKNCNDVTVLSMLQKWKLSVQK
nr:hypothetical protein [Tanacetum cinerariifolium]